MQILVIGGSGMLGSDLVEELRLRGRLVVAPPLADLDITDPESMANLSGELFGQPDWIINCAAYTAVDAAEADVRRATEINSIAPGYLAAAANALGAKLIHLSTDFVFDGKAREPYSEEAMTNPLGVYGTTKRDGEEAVFAANPNAIVIRTSWLFGPRGTSFPRTMIRAHEAGKKLRVVQDQVGNPTYTVDLARTIAAVVEANLFPGLYHATGPDTMSWFGFADLTLRTWAGSQVEIEPINSEDWPTPAVRPRYSVLSNEKLQGCGIAPMRPVEESMKEFCDRLRKEEGPL